MILNIHFDLLLGRKSFYHWSNFEPTNLKIRHKYLKNNLFVSIILERSCSLSNFSHLQGTKINFVTSYSEIRPNNFTTIVNIYLACSNLASNYPTTYIVFFSVIFTILQLSWTIDNVSFQSLERQQFEKRLVVFDKNVLL